MRPGHYSVSVMGKSGRRRHADLSNAQVIDLDSEPGEATNPYLQHRNLHSSGRSQHKIEPGSINPWTSKPYSNKYFEILKVRSTLPVNESRQSILNAVRQNNVVVLEGETGSGKTTQVPQFLVEAGYATKEQRVCCTQPRRVAAVSVAKRVSQEMDVALGKQVGYSVRFDDATSHETRLVYQTDGMLLREAMTDPLFSAYSVIVLDEAHERTLSTDILMGVLKELIQKRDDFRLIIMSATMDTGKFRDYFNNAPLLSVPGRMYPVEVIYSEDPETNYVDAAVNTAVRICENEGPGDILIFLTGEEEIEEVCRRIDESTRAMQHVHGTVKVYPLYGALPPDVQQRVFDPAPPPAYHGGPPGRKVICSTNIAETSLTIDGVVYVVDPGLSKQKVYNPRARVESLLVDNISKASAKQRKGRAGRTQKGKCYRLYTEESFKSDLLPTSYPEILRSNLGNVVLQMLKLGVKDLVHFDFMDAPAPETMMRALEMLNYLGAIDDDGQLTDFGHMMSRFPLDPEATAALIRSVDHHCSEEMLSIAAMLSEAANCFVFRSKRNGKRSRQGRNEPEVSPRAQFQDFNSDHITYLNVYLAYKQAEAAGKATFEWCKENFLNPRALKSASNVRRQLAELMRKNDLPLLSTQEDGKLNSRNIRKAILCGYYMQVAHRTDKPGKFCTAKDEELVRMHPTSGVSRTTKWVVYHEYVLTEKNHFIRTCTEVDAKWLVEIAPHYFDLNNFPPGVMKDSLKLAYQTKGSRSKQRS